MDFIHVIFTWLGLTLLILLLSLPLIHACLGLTLLQEVPRDSSWRYSQWRWKVAPLHFWLAIAIFSVMQKLSSLFAWHLLDTWSQRITNGLILVAVLLHFIWSLKVLRKDGEENDPTRRLARNVAWFTGVFLVLAMVVMVDSI